MKYFTVKEFCKEIKMCAHTVRKAIKMGKIYAIRPGIGSKSPYRIPATELERLQIASICGEKK